MKAIGIVEISQYNKKRKMIYLSNDSRLFSYSAFGYLKAKEHNVESLFEDNRSIIRYYNTDIFLIDMYMVVIDLTGIRHSISSVDASITIHSKHIPSRNIESITPALEIPIGDHLRKPILNLERFIIARELTHTNTIIEEMETEKVEYLNNFLLDIKVGGYTSELYNQNGYYNKILGVPIEDTVYNLKYIQTYLRKLNGVDKCVDKIALDWFKLKD